MGKKLFLVSLVITIILIFTIAAVPSECRCSIAGKNYDSQYDDESTVIITSEQESISIEIETTAETETAEETETVEETYVEETRPEEFILGFVLEESGIIIENMQVFPLTEVPVFYVSEQGRMLSRSFLSIDVSVLGLEKGTTIQEVELDLLNGSESGNPFSFYDSIAIETVNYGKRPLKMEDFNLGGFPVGFSTEPEIKLNTKELKDEFQKIIDKGESRFQIGLQLNGPKTENRPPEFGVSWEFKGMSLKVKF